MSKRESVGRCRERARRDRVRAEENHKRALRRESDKLYKDALVLGKNSRTPELIALQKKNRVLNLKCAHPIHGAKRKRQYKKIDGIIRYMLNPLPEGVFDECSA